ncbi:MAG: alpha/beta hydrolase [Gammaproteobacteria bacterium]
MESESILGELVTIKSARGFDLDGIVYRDDSHRTTIVHIHGSFGNFYKSRFVRLMAKKYSDAGINLLSVNLAGHDGLVEGYRNKDEFEYAGGAVADFNECTADIKGAVDFACQFSGRVILQGHSLGCDRVLQFLLSYNAQYDLILLAPCDSYQLQANWIAPETVEEQIQRLKTETPRDPEFDWLPTREYGIKGGTDWTYPIPITRKAFLSIAEGPPYRLIRITEPAQFRLNQRALIYIGGQDALQVWAHRVMFKYFAERIRNAEEIYMASGDHMLAGCEKDISERILRWAL